MVESSSAQTQAWGNIQIALNMNKHQGLSLVELLVGLAVALIILAGAGAAFIAHIASVSSSLQSDKMNHDIQVAFDIMINDLRRATYWNSETGVAPPNPFNAIYINGSCILYSYDMDNAAGTNISDGIQQDNERFGYKLNTGAIWMKKSGDAASATDCSTGSWERVTDPAIVNVSSLTFTLDVWCVNPNGLDPVTSTPPLVTNTTCTAITPTPTSGQRTIEIRGISVTARANVIGETDPPEKRLDAYARLRNNAMVTY